MTSLKGFTMSGCMVAVDVKLIHFLFYFLLWRLSLLFSLLVGGLSRWEVVVGVSINEFFSFTGIGVSINASILVVGCWM